MANIEQKKNFYIRNAEVKDIPEVYQMVKEFAIFEKLPQNVKIDLKEFEKDFSEKAFNCIVVQKVDGGLVGYSIYCQSYSSYEGKTLFLKNLYVKPEQRGIGVGKQLFLTTLKKGYDAGFKVVDFHILEWNPVVELYKKMGAVDISELEKDPSFPNTTGEFPKNVPINYPCSINTLITNS